MTERTWEILGKPAMIIQRKVDNPMWKTHPNIYECSWKFDRGRF